MILSSALQCPLSSSSLQSYGKSGFHLTKYLSILVGVILFAASSSRVFAAGQFVFDRITDAQGLSQNSIFAIAQDRQGYIWLGTEDGLNRYDGYDFLTFLPHPSDSQSVSDNHITCILEDSQGFIWIGTFNNGLNRFDTQTGLFKRFLPAGKEEDGISHCYIRALAEDKDGNIWIAAYGGGINKLDSKTGKFKWYKNDKNDAHSLIDNRVWCLFIDSKDNLWVGCWPGGLSRYNREKDYFISYPDKDGSPRSTNSNAVRSIAEDTQGNLLLATPAGLNILHPQNGQFTYFTHNPKDETSVSSNDIYTILKDSQGKIWLGTVGGGLNLFDPAAGKFLRIKNSVFDQTSLLDNHVWSLFQDRTGVIWVGTNGGINKFDYIQRQFYHIKHIPGDSNSLCHNRVRGFWEDEWGILWIGTWGGGLDRWDMNKNRYKHFDPGQTLPNFPDDVVRTIFRDSQGILWLGTGSSAGYFKSGTENFIAFKNDNKDTSNFNGGSVRCIIEDNEGYIWLGTNDRGIVRYDKKSKKFRHFRMQPGQAFSLPDDKIHSLLEDDHNFIWVGTASGLCKLDKLTGRVTLMTDDYGRKTALGGANVSTIAKCSPDILWAGTMGGGLIKLNLTTGEEKTYTLDHGLPSNVIYGILCDDHGNLWMSSNKGITRFHPQTENFKNFNLHKGLQGYEFNGGAYHKGKSGRMYFGGINGFNYFHPDSVFDDPRPPQPVITHFEILKTPGKIAGERADLLSPVKTLFTANKAELSSADKMVLLEFAGLHYYNSQDNLYAYMMEGFDKEWYYSGHRRYVSYTNLPAGRYQFIVKAANSDGVWSEESASLEIIVHPPWWRTFWFKLLGAGALVSAFWTVSYLRTRGLQKRRIELEDLVKQRTFELDHKAEELETRVLERTAELRAANEKLLKEITDKEKITDELKISEQRYKFLFDSAVDGIFLMERDIFVDCNPSVLTMFDCNREDLIWSTPYYFSPTLQPDGRYSKEKALELIDKALSGKPQRFEWQHRKKSGDLFEAEVILKNIRLNKKMYLFAIVRDITERKQSDSAIRKSEMKYRISVENSLEGIHITQDHILKFCNKKFAQMFGYSGPEEIIGRHIKDFVSPKSWNTVDEKVKARELGLTEVEHYYFAAVKKDGGEFEVETLGSRIEYEGRPAIHGVMRDVSERRRLEDQLWQAQKMEDIGRLAGGVAHDFNNMLTAIIGHCDLAKMDLRPEDPLMDYLEEIGRGADRAADLTRKLLALSRRQTMSPKVVSMNDIIADMYKMLYRIIGENIELFTLPSKEDWLVEIDPGQMEQVILNLAVNARDAMPQGGKLQVEVQNFAVTKQIPAILENIQPGDYVVLQVTDSGSGMTEEVKQKAFEPFFTTKPVGSGTGLGLATVYGIVKQSKGYIQLESEVAKGTTFRIFIPRQVDKVKSNVVKRDFRDLPRGNENILLVEDDTPLRETAVKILTRQGYTVTEAKNGNDALMICQRMTPPADLILTDVVMPGMGGMELVERVKEIWPGIKILFMSGYSDNALLKMEILTGKIEYLPKPFDLITMTRKVREVLDKTH